MTAIFYPDRWGISPDGSFVLEARSPHNGTINHRDGRPATEADFAFKYFEHQSEFRFRLLSRSGPAHYAGGKGGEWGRVVWERWQTAGEDSPHELLVSDDGWSVIRTHGFRPEVFIISPSGSETVRVRIDDAYGTRSHDQSGVEVVAEGAFVYPWVAKHLAITTAGSFWTGDSWPYFLRWRDDPYFVWRTRWGDRLVINLAASTLLTGEIVPPPALRAAMDDEEKRGALRLLVELSQHMEEIERLLHRRRSPDVDDDKGSEVASEPWHPNLRRLIAALHLAGAHRIAASLPYLRRWEQIDCPGSATHCLALGGEWQVQFQYFRPILHHSLRLFGEEPQGFPAIHFTRPGEERLVVPVRAEPPHVRSAQLTNVKSAQQVLDLMGTPDHVRRQSHPLGRGLHGWTEEWEFDSRKEGRWVVTRITWEENGRRGRIRSIEEVPPYWLETDQRVMELLSPF